MPGIGSPTFSSGALAIDETFLFKTQNRPSTSHSLVRGCVDDREGRLLVLAAAFRPLSAPKRSHRFHLKFFQLPAKLAIGSQFDLRVIVP
jgi:hypothetical protein